MDSTTLNHTVALVTGASRGAGKGITLALGDVGATVYVTGRSTRESPDPSGLPGTVEAISATLTGLDCRHFSCPNCWEYL